VPVKHSFDLWFDSLSKEGLPHEKENCIAVAVLSKASRSRMSIQDLAKCKKGVVD
jgi:hypothetical protein